MRRVLPCLLLLAPDLAHAQWTWLASPTGADLRGLSVPAPDVIWVSGSRGTVARSLDGGRTWTVDSVPGAGHLDFRSVHAFNDGAGIVASAGEGEKGLARVHATGDGGRHWLQRLAVPDSGAFFDAVVFRDVHRGLLLSDPLRGRFGIYVTTDKGASWTLLPDSLRPPALAGEAAFAASNGSLAVHGDSLAWLATGGGGHARVLRSRDGGRRWTSSTTPILADGEVAGVFAVVFHDATRGIAVGGDYMRPLHTGVSVALTDDGGRTWRAARSQPNAFISSVAYAGSAGDLVAVGRAGTFISRDGGDSWTRRDTTTLNAVRFHGKRGYAVGPRGAIARLDSLPP